uniref:(California timema) hypothetical protein n=1 Tax=Timema californicum TaxID=61474 RepID=A0A7R9JK60_TIMCA|nr:unnamed protein product [Timema californicum]
MFVLELPATVRTGNNFSEIRDNPLVIQQISTGNNFSEIRDSPLVIQQISTGNNFSEIRDNPLVIQQISTGNNFSEIRDNPLDVIAGGAWLFGAPPVSTSKLSSTSFLQESQIRDHVAQPLVNSFIELHMWEKRIRRHPKDTRRGSGSLAGVEEPEGVYWVFVPPLYPEAGVEPPYPVALSSRPSERYWSSPDLDTRHGPGSEAHSPGSERRTDPGPPAPTCVSWEHIAILVAPREIPSPTGAVVSTYSINTVISTVYTVLFLYRRERLPHLLGLSSLHTASIQSLYVPKIFDMRTFLPGDQVGNIGDLYFEEPVEELPLFAAISVVD